MSDQPNGNEHLDTGDTLPEDRADETPSDFQNAVEFVDVAIDDAEEISDLSVEALVVLNVLRIVKQPQKVRVNITRSQRLVVIELDVPDSDLGPLIGREGHTIDAIRDIAIASSGGSEIKYVIYPLEDGRPPRIGMNRSARSRNYGGRSYRNHNNS